MKKANKRQIALETVKAFIRDNADQGPFHYKTFPYDELETKLTANHVYVALKQLVENGDAKYVKSDKVKCVQFKTGPKVLKVTEVDCADLKTEADEVTFFDSPEDEVVIDAEAEKLELQAKDLDLEELLEGIDDDETF